MRPFILGEFPKVIDSTIRAEFVSCHTKGYWSFIRKLGPTEPSTDLIAGGAFARGLEVMRLRLYGDGKNLVQSLEEGMIAAIEAYGEHEPNENKQQKNVTRVVEALHYYVTVWDPRTDDLQPFMAEGKPAVEYTFSVPLPITHPTSGEPILYAGRFDMVGVWKKEQLLADDEKTTSQLGPTWVAKWNLRGQFTGYVWALRLFNIPAVGALVRGISFLKNSFGHSESLQMRSQWLIDAWFAQLVRDIEQAKEAYVSGWYNQNFDETCAGYSGCPFQSLCLSSNPENWIEGKYAKRDWDPLRKIPYVQPERRVEVIQAPDELRRLMK